MAPTYGPFPSRLQPPRLHVTLITSWLPTFEFRHVQLEVKQKGLLRRTKCSTINACMLVEQETCLLIINVLYVSFFLACFQGFLEADEYTDLRQTVRSHNHRDFESDEYTLLQEYKPLDIHFDRRFS